MEKIAARNNLFHLCQVNWLLPLARCSYLNSNVSKTPGLSKVKCVYTLWSITSGPQRGPFLLSTHSHSCSSLLPYHPIAPPHLTPFLPPELRVSLLQLKDVKRGFFLRCLGLTCQRIKQYLKEASFKRKRKGLVKWAWGGSAMW